MKECPGLVRIVESTKLRWPRGSGANSLHEQLSIWGIFGPQGFPLMSRLFSFLRRSSRPARRRGARALGAGLPTSPMECLESRQLLAVTPISSAEVELLLNRAAVATSSKDAIIAVVDRGGRILGVRVEEDVLTAYGNLVSADGIVNAPAEEETLVFAIDGAVAKARTTAFFANGTADSRINPETGADPAGDLPTVGPLTSRTIRNISQSTITQREMQSNPNESNLMKRGPGFVAPVGIGGHFPPAIAHAPQVDLFGIEHTNRDSIVHPGANSIRETTDPTLTILGGVGDGQDILLPGRFNTTYEAGKDIEAPESYGFTSRRMTEAQSRGIATLPGGIPLYRGFDVVGGIGVFFPGTVDADGTAGPQQLGDATFEQGFVPGIKQTEAQRTNAPKVLEAEYIAFAAAGGATFGGLAAKDKIGKITGADGNVLAAVPFVLPFGRIDLVGITLQIIGPTAGVTGVRTVEALGKKLGVGHNTGSNQVVDPGADFDPTTLGDNLIVRPGVEVPEGWLVKPPVGSDAETIILQAIETANATRAAIRLKVTNTTKGTTVPGARTRMVLAVADADGNILGLYRMHDSTIFSIDVAVAKARNTAYYADPAQLALNPGDQVADDNVGGADMPLGTAFSNRTFRFLAEPRYPQGVDGSKPGDFSILNDPGFKTILLKSTNPTIAAGAVENFAAPVSASVFSLSTTSVLGFDSFNPGRNFRQMANIANQNGVIFFPGSTPVYNSGALVGGYGVSGDGVDQDDVVTFFGVNGFRPPAAIQADHFFVRGTRLPYQKFNRNPFA